MNPLGLYSPGTSVVHRFPAGPGLLVVLVLTTATLLVPIPAVLAGLAMLRVLQAAFVTAVSTRFTTALA